MWNNSMEILISCFRSFNELVWSGGFWIFFFRKFIVGIFCEKRFGFLISWKNVFDKGRLSLSVLR